jgi:hypothetical protein
MGKQAKIKASFALVPIRADPKSFVGTNQPMNAAMIAGRKTYENIFDKGMSSGCTGFLTLALDISLFFKEIPRMIKPIIRPTPAAAKA